MAKRYECPKCDGYGIQMYFDGDGYPQQDACYHCGNTGWVNYNPYPTEEELNAELREIANGNESICLSY